LKSTLRNTTIQFIIIFYIILLFLFLIQDLHPLITGIIIVFSIFLGLCIFYGGVSTFKSGWPHTIFEFTRNSIRRKLIFIFIGLFFELIGGYSFIIGGLPLAYLGFAMLSGVFYNILDKKGINSFLLCFILAIPILIWFLIFSIALI